MKDVPNEPNNNKKEDKEKKEGARERARERETEKVSDQNAHSHKQPHTATHAHQKRKGKQDTSISTQRRSIRRTCVMCALKQRSHRNKKRPKVERLLKTLLTV